MRPLSHVQASENFKDTHNKKKEQRTLAQENVDKQQHRNLAFLNYSFITKKLLVISPAVHVARQWTLNSEQTMDLAVTVHPVVLQTVKQDKDYETL